MAQQLATTALFDVPLPAHAREIVEHGKLLLVRPIRGLGEVTVAPEDHAGVLGAGRSCVGRSADGGPPFSSAGAPPPGVSLGPLGAQAAPGRRHLQRLPVPHGAIVDQPEGPAVREEAAPALAMGHLAARRLEARPKGAADGGAEEAEPPGVHR